MLLLDEKECEEINPFFTLSLTVVETCATHFFLHPSFPLLEWAWLYDHKEPFFPDGLKIMEEDLEFIHT